MSETFYLVSEDAHNNLVTSAFVARGYTLEEGKAAAELGAYASRHGVRTHNAIKALHLDELFGSGAGGCQPGAQIEKIPGRFPAAQVWNANRKLGQATAWEAIDTCIDLAKRFGVGMVSVDNAFHYLWGGGYVMKAASEGFIAYTNCTAALAEVVPFKGKFPTLGTNPHSWSFPTTEALGFPIVIDWATSVVAMGRVQQFAREGKQLPPDAAVDAEGNPTTDPHKAVSLLPFGAHKGYALSLINELTAAFIGGSLPTLRSRWSINPDEKHTPAFFFQVIHPDALASGDFALGRSQQENVEAVLRDILGHGNEHCLLPGQIEAEAARRSRQAGGLLFSAAEIDAFNEIAAQLGLPLWDKDSLPLVS